MRLVTHADHAELFIGGTWQPPAGGSLGGTPPAAKLGRPDDPPGKRLRSKQFESVNVVNINEDRG